MSSEQQVEHRSPLGVVPKDNEPKGFCQVIFVIPDLKTSRGLSGGKIVKKPSSGSFDKSFEQNSFSFWVDCKGGKKNILKYSFAVKKLPGNIAPEGCKIKFDDGKVIVSLKKADDVSWERELSSNGIEQFGEEGDDTDSYYVYCDSNFK